MADLVVTVPSGTLTLPADVIVPAARIPDLPTDAVSSVNGETGAVVLDAADVGAATAAQGAKADAALPAANLDTAATALDANPASALRVQQDARLSSTYARQIDYDTMGGSTGTVALPSSLSDQAVHDITLTGDVTLTVPTETAGRTLSVLVRQDPTGGHTLTWPADVLWVGVTPTMTAAAWSADLYTLLSLGDGRWMGFVSAQGFAMPIPAPAATALVTDTTASLHWDAVTGATGYEVQIDADAVVDVLTATAWTFGGLTAGTAHAIQVRAYVASGTRSAWTAEAVTTDAAKSVAVADPFTAADATAINGRTTPTGALTWTSPNANPVGAGKLAGTITSNAITTANVADGMNATVTMPQQDVRVSATYALTVVGTPQARVFARVRLPDTNIGVTAYIRHNGQLFISVVNGTGVLLASGQPLTGKLTLQAQGDIFTVMVNDVVKGTRQLTGHVGTLAGISTYENSSTMDNFEVTYL